MCQVHVSKGRESHTRTRARTQAARRPLWINLLGSIRIVTGNEMTVTLRRFMTDSTPSSPH